MISWPRRTRPDHPNRKSRKQSPMSAPRKIAVLVGSLRKGSYNRMMAKALAALAPQSLKLEIIEIGQLPLYNQDDDGPNPPAAWAGLRERIRAADAVLFVTPEYN